MVRSLQGRTLRLFERRPCPLVVLKSPCDKSENEEADSEVGTRPKCEEGQVSETIEALDRLVQQGVFVPLCLFYQVLIREKDLVGGRHIHGLVWKSGYGSNVYLGNHLIRMYSSHGKWQEASEVFSSMVVPDKYSWSSVILAHAEHGEPERAIKLYSDMRQSVVPDNHIIAAVLKACAKAEDLMSGKQVHADFVKSATEPDVFVGNCLVDMYAKCGSLDDAREVFDNLTAKNVVTWNIMLAGYARQGLGQEALTLYAHMQDESILQVSHATFVCLLKACGSIGALHQGKQIHSQIQERGLESDLVIGSCLVDMYVKCVSLEDARSVFDSLPVRDVVTWTIMLAGYAQRGLGEEALNLYASMLEEGMAPADLVTFVCLLNACASIGALHQGKQLHSQIRDRGLTCNLVIGNCLVDMYAKCGSMDDARKFFDNMTRRDVVTWNAMLTGYVQHGLGHEALSLYAKMQQEDVIKANRVTFLCLLQACGITGVLQSGKELHSHIRESGMTSDLVIGNCLVDMYAKCGSLDDACRVFDKLATKSVVTWNAMLTGYVEHGLGEEALSLYASMQEEGITAADSVTFICLLNACASAGALHLGKKLHSQIQGGGLEVDVVIGSCLVDMYAKCGSLDDARTVFENLGTRNEVTWTAMIAAYGQHGLGDEALHCYERMRVAGIKPSAVTFLALLFSCSHAGLVDRGAEYFESMTRDYGITPSAEHYAKMIDLFGRAGCFSKVKELLSTMPMQPDLGMWLILLGACRKHGNVVLGEQAFSSAVQLQPKHSAAYVLMSHIYADAGLAHNAKKVHTWRVMNRAWKEPGSSWIEHQHVTHTFLVGDQKHPEHDQLYDLLQKLTMELKNVGLMSQ